MAALNDYKQYMAATGAWLRKPATYLTKVEKALSMVEQCPPHLLPHLVPEYEITLKAFLKHYTRIEAIAVRLDQLKDKGINEV